LVHGGHFSPPDSPYPARDAETTSVDLVHFDYKEIGLPNGALFLNFKDAKKSQYLVFLKKYKSGQYLPVTGHYDAALSIKHIQKDHFSPITVEE